MNDNTNTTEIGSNNLLDLDDFISSAPTTSVTKDNTENANIGDHKNNDSYIKGAKDIIENSGQSVFYDKDSEDLIEGNFGHSVFYDTEGSEILAGKSVFYDDATNKEETDNNVDTPVLLPDFILGPTTENTTSQVHQVAFI